MLNYDPTFYVIVKFNLTRHIIKLNDTFSHGNNKLIDSKNFVFAR